MIRRTFILCMILMLTVLILMTTTACNAINELLPTSIKNISSMSAAEVVEAYFTALYENRFDDALRYVDEQSLALRAEAFESVDDWRKRVVDMHFENDITLENILVESIGDIDGYEGFRVRIRLAVNGEQETFNEPNQYVIKSNDGYKVLAGNIIDVSDMSCTVSWNVNNEKLTIDTSFFYTVNGFAVASDFVNESSVNFQFGWVNTGSIIIETDVSTYSESFPHFTRVPAHGTNKVLVQFEGASGNVKRISITNLIELSGRGLPARTGDPGETVVLWDLEFPSINSESEHESKEDKEPEPEFDPEQIDLSALSAMEVVELFYTCIYKNHVDFAISLLDEESMEATGNTREGMLESIDDYLSQSEYVLEDIELKSVGNLNGFDGFSVAITVISNGILRTIDEGVSRTTQRDDGFKIIVNNTISAIEPEPPNLDNGDLNIFASRVVKSIDSYTVTIEVINNSSSTYKPGWVGGSKVILTTDEGTFSTEMFFMNQHISTQFMVHHTYTYLVTIEGVRGDVQKISVDSIIRLDSRGFPAGHNTTGATYVIFEA